VNGTPSTHRAPDERQLASSPASRQYDNPGYAFAASDYLENGWQPLPLLNSGKGVVPPGFTGYNAKPVTQGQVDLWSAEHPESGVALHLTEQIALDVDNYSNDSRGLRQGDAAEALRELESDLGALPPTIVVSSRLIDSDYDGHSGIRIFRLPASHMGLVRERIWKSEAGPGIDVIRFGHRQVVAWPSRHPSRGSFYAVLDQRTGVIYEGPLPPVDTLPELPRAWADYLIKGPSRATAGPEAQTPALEELWTPGDPCPRIQYVLDTALRALPDARHDTARDTLLHLSRLGEQGHQGVGQAVQRLRQSFVRSRVDDTEKGQWRIDDEWDRMLPGIVDILARDGLTDPADKRCCTAQTGEPWPQIVDLFEGTRTPFPVDALPVGMQAAVREVAHSRMVDPAIPAAAFLGVAAGALGDRIHVSISSSWHTKCNLYIVAIAETGDGKSPGISPALEPLQRLEERLQAEATDRRRQARAELPRLKALIKEEGKKSHPDSKQILDIQRRIDDYEATLRSEPRIIVDDVTPERLTELLAENDGRIVAINDEGALFAHLLGMYSSSPNLGPFLKAWDGTRLTMDRKGANGQVRTAIIVNSPRMTMLAAVQPRVIVDLGGNRHKALRQRGVLGRLLVCWPQPMAGKRNLRDQPRDSHLRFVDTWNSHVEQLALSADEYWLTFSAEAYNEFVEWHDRLEARLPAGEVYSEVKDFVVKIREQVARIAALFAVLDGVHDNPEKVEVGPQHVTQAIRLGEYFVRTAMAVVESWQDRPVALAQKLIAKVIRQRKPNFTVRDAYRLAKAKKEDVLHALELLDSHGYVRPADPEVGFGQVNDRGVGRVSPTVVLNPSLWNP
jgi:hypothetical protein